MEIVPAVADELGEWARRISEEHQQVMNACADALDHAHAAGELLLQAKARLGHGKWLPWLRHHCGFSARTAQAYMRVAVHWPQLRRKAQHVAHLPLRNALKLIAAPSYFDAATLPDAPEAQEVVQLARWIYVIAPDDDTLRRAMIALTFGDRKTLSSRTRRVYIDAVHKGADGRTLLQRWETAYRKAERRRAARRKTEHPR